MDWEGVDFGVKIGERLNTHDMRLARIEKDMDRAKLILSRAGLVVLLWTGGLLTKVPSETIGDVLAGLLKALAK